MVKKAGKPDVSKKTVQKQKQKVLEDKTFGLKNKNKSKKVQQKITSIEKSVMNSGDPKLRRLEELRKKAREDAKARAKAAKEEQDALFGAALLAVQKKGHVNQQDGKVEAKGRDHDLDDKKNATSRAMKMMYQMDAQEMSDKLREDPNYVPTIEDEIDFQRQKMVEELKKTGKGTPVTPETFAAWKERKRKVKLEENKKKVQAELKKKKGGKGLSVLTGRDLYEFKKDLFDKDDFDEEELSASSDGGDEVESSMPASANGDAAIPHGITEKTSNLFLQGDDDDLDDLEDD